MDSSIPFTEALPLADYFPFEWIGNADNYINDFIVVILGQSQQRHSRLGP